MLKVVEGYNSSQMLVKKLKTFSYKHLLLLPLVLVSVAFASATFASSANQSNITTCKSSGNCYSSTIQLASGCGSGSGYVQTSFDFGCKGNACPTDKSLGSGYCSTAHSGITDLLFAIIRFLSDGVGLLIVLSVTIGGVQYITSRGEPQGTQAAIKRLTSSMVALLVFIFAYAILNYVIPGGFFSQ